MKNNIEDWNPEHKKICFVAIPKTGSNYIRKVISTNKKSFPGHVSLNSIWSHSFKTEKWKKSKDFYNFSIIRNPYDLLASLVCANAKYNFPYLFRGDTNDQYRPITKEIFSEFVIKKLDNEENVFFGLIEKYRHNTHLYNSFYKIPFIQIFDNDGNIGVDAILRYENFNDNMKIISKYCKKNINYELVERESKIFPNIYGKTMQKTLHSYKSYYSKEAINKMKEKLGWFIDIFGYDFEGVVGENNLVIKTSDIPDYHKSILKENVIKIFKMFSNKK